MRHHTRSNPRHDSHDRMHWTRKGSNWKPKVCYRTEDEALQVLKRGIMQEGYAVYQCHECGFYHIGFRN